MIKSILLLISFGLALSACGKKGDLMPPDPAEEQASFTVGSP